MLDIFNSDPFSVVSLTDAINNTKFVPGRLSQLGIFLESSVAVTTVTFEEKAGKTWLVVHDLYPTEQAVETGSTGALPEALDQLDELLASL